VAPGSWLIAGRRSFPADVPNGVPNSANLTGANFAQPDATPGKHGNLTSGDGLQDWQGRAAPGLGRFDSFTASSVGIAPFPNLPVRSSRDSPAPGAEQLVRGRRASVDDRIRPRPAGRLATHLATRESPAGRQAGECSAVKAIVAIAGADAK
jgi:hypothetical protein